MLCWMLLSLFKTSAAMSAHNILTGQILCVTVMSSALHHTRSADTVGTADCRIYSYTRCWGGKIFSVQGLQES